MNPLNALGVREVSYLPIHFVKTEIPFFEIENIRNWVTHKLSGRFCIIESPNINEKNKLQTAIFIAFENHQELTYLMLGCPYLRR